MSYALRSTPLFVVDVFRCCRFRRVLFMFDVFSSCLDKEYVVTANYRAGSVSVFSLDPKTHEVSAPLQSIAHSMPEGSERCGNHEARTCSTKRCAL